MNVSLYQSELCDFIKTGSSISTPNVGLMKSPMNQAANFSANHLRLRKVLFGYFLFKEKVTM